MKEEKETENSGLRIRYAEIQASNLWISIAVLMTIFDTPVGQAYEIRQINYAVWHSTLFNRHTHKNT